MRQDSDIERLADEVHDADAEMLAAVDALNEAELWREDVDRRKSEMLYEIEDEERRAFTAWKTANYRYQEIRRARAQRMAS